MRKFAKICNELKNDCFDIPDTLEEVLNAEISIEGPTKSAAISFSSTVPSNAVHPNVINHPDFIFLPASYKLQRVNSYHDLKKELDRVK